MQYVTHAFRGYLLAASFLLVAYQQHHHNIHEFLIYNTLFFVEFQYSLSNIETAVSVTPCKLFVELFVRTQFVKEEQTFTKSEDFQKYLPLFFWGEKFSIPLELLPVKDFDIANSPKLLKLLSLKIQKLYKAVKRQQCNGILWIKLK